MSGSLNDSPAAIIRQLLIDQGLGVDPEATGGNWSTYRFDFPDSPDKAIAVTGTEGRLSGRYQPSGEMAEHHGIQVRARSVGPDDAENKMRAILNNFDQTIRRTSVTVGNETYLIHAITRTGDVLSLGRDVAVSGRFLYSLNAVVALRQQAGTG